MEQTSVGFINGLPENASLTFHLIQTFTTQGNFTAMPPILQQMIHAWSTGGWVMPALSLRWDRDVFLRQRRVPACSETSLSSRTDRSASDSDVRTLGAQAREKAPEQCSSELIRYTQDEVHFDHATLRAGSREVESSMIQLTWIAGSRS